MKSISKIVMVLLVAGMLLSACKVQTATPPTVEPTATPEVTEAPTQSAQGNDPTATADPNATPTPTQDLRLFDDAGKMICTPSEPFFPELTDEQKAQLAIFPEITDADWQIGPKDAMLTIIEYSDFQCPACSAFYAELEKFLAKYPDEIRLVFRHFPLTSLHPNAVLAAQASEAAGLQGKFWDMYDSLFTKQKDWSSMSTEDFTDWLEAEAKSLGLDDDKFKTDLVSDTIVKKVADDLAYGTSIGLNSTPTILLNGRPWQYDWSSATLSLVMEVLKAEKDLKRECPPYVIDQNKTYTATIKTEKGDLVIELYPKEAPLAVNSFVFLARAGFYDGVTFHRVMHNFVAQAGDPSGTGISGSGYEYREETSAKLTFDEPYMVGVARAQAAGTSGSQFFITYVPYSQLNGQYTIFGKLIEGQDVLAKITERDASTNPDAAPGDKIISITITEK